MGQKTRGLEDLAGREKTQREAAWLNNRTWLLPRMSGTQTGGALALKEWRKREAGGCHKVDSLRDCPLSCTSLYM